jgi:phosphatidylserine/phosphatidylglycerophosphate/cardiolipin synthase-like enzyme
MKKLAPAIVLLGCALAGCAWQRDVRLSDETVTQLASAGPLTISEARAVTDNDAAFQSKLRLVEGAQKSIDMMYYIYSDDHSSSVLTKALLDAARRGVKVRLIVDYQTNYNRLDLFSMMEKEGKGNLRVRFYNRPTANIVKDAVFMTMGCSREMAGSRQADCGADKFAAIDRLFADEMIDGKPAAGRNISNLNIGNSGLFLSGLYSKRGDVLALAVQTGEGIDVQKLKSGGSATSPEEKEQLKQLGKTYWESRTGGLFQRLESNAALFFAFAMYGQQLNPLKETVTSILPIDRKLGNDEVRDWDHFTDYTHHKFLLVDRSAIQMGGRNVENSYHMHPNPLVSKYVFMDTDIYATLTQGGDAVARAFENLWDFTDMVATLPEVRQHAPNDFVVNLKYAEKSCGSHTGKKEKEACVEKESRTNVHGLEERMADTLRAMEENARAYTTGYAPTIPMQQTSGFPLDKESTLAYLENLPFNKALPPEKRQRTYGALAGEEAQGGKYIHDLWLREIPAICAAATPDNPKRVVLHNAYFFPAANLTYALSRMANGDYDCSNVTVTVLTNSIDTTDLNVVNIAAHHSLKAFSEFYQQQSDPARRATFDYYEYQRPATGANLSLHSKVSVFGDDVIIGSANADVRSFMMDSNNAMLIRNAPGFAKDYLSFVQGILSDPSRTKKLNDYFAATPRDVILQEDLATFRQIMAKYGADKRLNEEGGQKVEARFVQMLNDVYEQTKASITKDGTAEKRREEQNRFNKEFKPI